MAEGKVEAKGTDDPVLDAALSEMHSEGALDDSPVDPTPAEPAGAAVVETPADGADPSAAPQEPDPALVAPIATPTEPAVDPLKDTAPLDYAVDGTAKAFDGILIDKTNGGAFILPDKVDSVRARLIEGDRAQGTARQLYDQVQQYERMGGVEGYAKLKADAEANSAAGLFLMKTLADAFPGPEHAEALKQVFERAEFMMQKAQFDTTQKFHVERQAVVSQGQQSQQETVVLRNALGQIQTALPSLTADDMTAGQQMFGGEFKDVLYRSATPQDVQQYGVKLGERMFDPTKMNAWFSERASWRSKEAEKAKALATATAKAGSFNAGQEKGRQVGKPNGRAPEKAAPAPKTPEKVSRSQAWATPLDAALAELGVNE